MSVSQGRSGRWKAECFWEGTKFYIGLFHSREAAETAVVEEYAKLRAGTSTHVVGRARLTLRTYAENHLRARYGTVKRWASEGMPCHRSGSVVRIDPDEADAWVREHHPNSIAFGRASVVYVVQRDTDNAVKVGWSSDVMRRMGELRKKCGAAICLYAAVPGDKPLELRVHRALADRHIGNEWYSCEPEDAIRALMGAA